MVNDGFKNTYRREGLASSTDWLIDKKQYSVGFEAGMIYLNSYLVSYMY